MSFYNKEKLNETIENVKSSNRTVNRKTLNEIFVPFFLQNLIDRNQKIIDKIFSLFNNNEKLKYREKLYEVILYLNKFIIDKDEHKISSLRFKTNILYMSPLNLVLTINNSIPKNEIVCSNLEETDINEYIISRVKTFFIGRCVLYVTQKILTKILNIPINHRIKKVDLCIEFFNSKRFKWTYETSMKLFDLDFEILNFYNYKGGKYRDWFRILKIENFEQVLCSLIKNDHLIEDEYHFDKIIANLSRSDDKSDFFFFKLIYFSSKYFSTKEIAEILTINEETLNDLLLIESLKNKNQLLDAINFDIFTIYSLTKDGFRFLKLARFILFRGLFCDINQNIKYRFFENDHTTPLANFIDLNLLKRNVDVKKYNETIDVHDEGRDYKTIKCVNALIAMCNLSDETIDINFSEFWNFAMLLPQEEKDKFDRIMGMTSDMNSISSFGDFPGFLSGKIIVKGIEFNPKLVIACFWEFCKNNNIPKDFLIDGFLKSYQYKENKWYCVCNPGKLQNISVVVLQGRLLINGKYAMIDDLSQFDKIKSEDELSPAKLYLKLKPFILSILESTTDANLFFKELFRYIDDNTENINLEYVIKMLCLYSENKNGFVLNSEYSIASSLENCFDCDEYTHLIEQSKVEGGNYYHRDDEHQPIRFDDRTVRNGLFHATVVRPAVIEDHEVIRWEGDYQRIEQITFELNEEQRRVDTVIVDQRINRITIRDDHHFDQANPIYPHRTIRDNHHFDQNNPIYPHRIIGRTATGFDEHGAHPDVQQDIDEGDIRLIMDQSGHPREECIRAYINNDRDIVNAIMEITL